MIYREIFTRKKWLFDTVIAGIVINFIALTVSLYSLLVYDRVVPSGASQTLLVLTLGIFTAILYEYVAKKVRSGLFERLINEIDQRLARGVYLRFLNVRLDQLPTSIGSLASQMRGYETVRAFLTGVTTHLLVDIPYAFLFAGVIFLIADWLAVIPLVFFLLSLIIGRHYKKQVTRLAEEYNTASSFKTGLLVESVEGAETIKSGQGGWRMLSRWMSTTDKARTHEMRMRNITENSQHLIIFFQQISYVSLIASGALLISQGELTIGSLIACSILSGRILAPVVAIPNQLVLWAHTKAALKALDALWALEDDHFGQQQPVILDHIKGKYQCDNITVKYGDDIALRISNLQIKPGEKVAVLGQVGAGKTTLLRLLSGMYKPQSGSVRLDDVDLTQVSKPILAEHIGYVHQEGRLFAGTVRENLILGLLDPGDEILLETARKTGLLETVIASHPLGLQRPISEGGSGLSGGQRQLVHLTRAFLRNPDIWLLDEPTASMDRYLELRVRAAIDSAIKPTDTLILVTHKADMLSLVDRIIVVSDQQIVMDGPRDSVLSKLRTPKSVPSQPGSKPEPEEEIA
ncbi:MAG: ATP-binding cassette domain-containing protein, partial [Hyphomicrobiaceae bacterium]|nr:ATP-binding cassette domain-containing protein [Hyphomicrobiaceae bacterium]